MLPEKASIASVWDKRLEYGYPVPYVERNMHVHAADEATTLTLTSTRTLTLTLTLTPTQ